MFIFECGLREFITPFLMIGIHFHIPLLSNGMHVIPFHLPHLSLIVSVGLGVD